METIKRTGRKPLSIIIRIATLVEKNGKKTPTPCRKPLSIIIRIATFVYFNAPHAEFTVGNLYPL